MIHLAVALTLAATLQAAAMSAPAAAALVQPPLADELVNRPSPQAPCIAPLVRCDDRA